MRFSAAALHVTGPSHLDSQERTEGGTLGGDHSLRTMLAQSHAGSRGDLSMRVPCGNHDSDYHWDASPRKDGDDLRDTYECFICHAPGPHHRKTGMRAHSDCWIRAMYGAYAVQMR